MARGYKLNSLETLEKQKEENFKEFRKKGISYYDSKKAAQILYDINLSIREEELERRKERREQKKEQE